MKKRVGIILDSISVTKQIADLIALSKTSKKYEITALVINNIEQKNKEESLQNLIKIKYLQRIYGN